MRRLLTTRNLLFAALPVVTCALILAPVITVIRTWVRTVREVVRRVCEWVSTTIRTVRTVVERVCRALPWPLSELCNLVSRVIEVVETVWNFVCREIVERIIRWIEVVLEYVYYVLRWVCWIVDWVRRGPALLLCLLGFRPTRFMRVCVKVLTDADGAPAVPLGRVDGMMRDAAAIFARCNIRVILNGPELVRKEEFLDTTRCEFSGMFSDFFVWFSGRACGEASTVTVYFVRGIVDADGCAYPGTNWVTVDGDHGDGTVVVQEIGHLAGLWPHSGDPNNVMTDQPDGTHDQVTAFQCCMIRTSEFTSATGPIEVIEATPEAVAAATLKPAEEPFERRPRRGRNTPY